MSRGRLVAAALALSLLVAGCGDDDNTPSGAEAGSTSTTVAGGPGGASGDDGHGHTEPTLVDPKTGKQGKIRESDNYSAVAPPPVAFRQPDIGAPEPGGIPLSASVTPGCVEHGQEVTAVMKSEPGITLVAQIKWPNEQFSGLDNTDGKAGPDGTLTWKVRVQPTALYGQADLMVAAIDEANSSRKGTSGSWQFVVTPPGRC